MQLFPVSLEDLRDSLHRARARKDDFARRSDPRTLGFLRWFRTQWESVPEHAGRQYVIAWQRDGAIAKRLLAQLDSRDLADRVARMLASKDPFVARTGRDLPTLERFSARFATDSNIDQPAGARRRGRSSQDIRRALGEP